MKTATRLGMIVALAGCLAAGTLQAAVFNSSPFGLIAQSGDHWVASNPLTWNGNWTNQPVTAIIVDEQADDPVQSGTISVQTTSGGAWQQVSTYATNNSNSNAGLLFAMKPTASYGVQVVANGTVPPMGRSIWRVGNVDYLLRSPGTNLALSATSFGTGSNPAGVIDTSIDHAGRWRADPSNATENYVGLTWAAPTMIGALRVTNGMSTGTGYMWSNYYVQLQYTPAGAWYDVGQASQDTSHLFYWIDLGGTMYVTGVRLYGSTARGNNPTASDGLIVDELQVFVPEPASLSLLALGALALIRRRRTA